MLDIGRICAPKPMALIWAESMNMNFDCAAKMEKVGDLLGEGSVTISITPDESMCDFSRESC